MTKEQRKAHRLANNLCLYCGKDGHTVATCPTAPKRPEVKAEGEVEGEVAQSEGKEGFQASDL